MVQHQQVRIVGIDPGQKGALVLLDGDNIEMHQMPDNAGEIVDILSSISDCHIFLEKAQAMSISGVKQGVSSMFNYGVGFGTLLGIIAALKIPHTLVHPKTWCKEMHQGTSEGDAKQRSLEAVRRLYPHVNLIRPRCRKPDEGFIDALLIAGYGTRILNRN
jgi:crossover junction endodeoxyribonuclease RuvC